VIVCKKDNADQALLDFFDRSRKATVQSYDKMFFRLMSALPSIADVDAPNGQVH
jgi:hypothetical protein